MHIDIRTATQADLPMIVEIYNEGVEDGTANCDLYGFTAAQKQAWFEVHGGRYPIWVAILLETIVGWACLFPYETKACFERSATFSTYVARSHRGKKVGSRLRQHTIEQAKQLGFHTLVNRVFVANEASIELAKKFGFQQVGRMQDLVYRNGSYQDCVFFQLMLED